ncbi:secretin N-terminal domain-containing protein [Vibrio anguillarum]|uniref:secretin N-terminal domain-containing protein n=1 Tax=Vibrio anguillarum TaxID=55601 RepID=UPI00188CE1F9|nr:secretin N-terminal domain-containing protein [Vibrio anguillarum]MBF4333912.1 type II secretory pathway protein [Vibrio anguillarum]
MKRLIASLLSFSLKKKTKNYCAVGKLQACAVVALRCGKVVNKQLVKFINYFSTSSKFVLLIALTCSSGHANETQLFESNNTPIGEFVSWYSGQTGLKIVLGQGVSGAVSFTAPDLLPSEYPAFFDSVLRSHGYLLEKDSGAYVVKINTQELTIFEPAEVKLYRLNNVRNTKIVDLMTATLRATVSQSLKDKPLDNYGVQVLPTTNALIVSGTAEQLRKIDAIIEGVDTPQRQVFIEAIITETELGDNQELGVNLQAAFDSAGFITNLALIDKAKDNVLFFEGGNFDALVKAVSTNQHTELLSRPNMLIMDRERGYITVGQNVPFLVSSEVTDGGNTIQRIERKDVGVTLEVTPHVLGGEVVLVINQESSTVTDSAIAADIITNKRTLSTVVKVSDKQTIALGGLISSEERNSVSGVPVLMDIPLLGGLFRSEGKKQVKKELKVVIKTTIL